jgi:hypothetical protein
MDRRGWGGKPKIVNHIDLIGRAETGIYSNRILTGRLKYFHSKIKLQTDYEKIGSIFYHTTVLSKW